MKKLLEKRWVKRIWATVNFVIQLRVPLYASHASFFIVLSVFPLLVLLMGLVRYAGLEAELVTEMLHGIVPTALMPATQRLILNTYQSTTGAVVSVSVLTALWSASLGVYGLTTGFNSIYETTEDRGYFYTRLLSVLYTFVFLIVLLLTLVLHVFGTMLMEWLPFQPGPLLGFLEGVVDLRFFLLLGVQTAVFAGMYTALPNGKHRLRDAFPGAVFSSIGWLVFSDLYSIYVENYASLSNVYGSVYAVALSMLWLYCCVAILFYGGALNHWLSRKERSDKV